MAALSHMSVIIPVTGVIAPIIIWATQKDKSRYSGFQALQALTYQVVNILVFILGFACYFGTFFLSMILTVALDSANKGGAAGSEFLMVFLPFSVMFLIGALQLLFILYGIVAAVFSLQGKPFKYLIIGKRIEQYLQKKDETTVQKAA